MLPQAVMLCSRTGWNKRALNHGCPRTKILNTRAWVCQSHPDLFLLMAGKIYWNSVIWRFRNHLTHFQVYDSVTFTTFTLLCSQFPGLSGKHISPIQEPGPTLLSFQDQTRSGGKHISYRPPSWIIEVLILLPKGLFWACCQHALKIKPNICFPQLSQEVMLMVVNLSKNCDVQWLSTQTCLFAKWLSAQRPPVKNIPNPGEIWGFLQTGFQWINMWTVKVHHVFLPHNHLQSMLVIHFVESYEGTSKRRFL